MAGIGSKEGISVHPAIAASILGGFILFVGFLYSEVNQDRTDIAGMKVTVAHQEDEDRKISAIEGKLTDILLAVQDLKGNSDYVKSRLTDLQTDQKVTDDFIRPLRVPPPTR
jgi:hypothetical protein